MPRFSLRTLGRPGECPEEKGAHLSSLRIRKDLRQQNFINMELIKFCIFDAKKGIHRRSSDRGLRDAFEGI